ncbi:MAG: hypothetical protein ACFFDF_03935 [Candidatus Odinarchaeota archaeon]
MKDFRKVPLSKLQYFQILLETEKSRSRLLSYYNEEILYHNKNLNDLKKQIYNAIKHNKNNEKCSLLYKLYQDLKNKSINIEKAWDRFIDIL